jgi:hypothetical protein
VIRPSVANRALRDAPQELRQFLEHYFVGDAIKLRPPQDCLLAWEGITTMVLYREGQFQVELVIVEPDTKIPAHCHDDVESYEVAIGGQLEFFVDGTQSGFFREPRADGVSRDLGKFVPVRADAWHGGRSGPQGACFLSVQRWRDGVAPDRVGRNWHGPAMGERHAAELGR